MLRGEFCAMVSALKLCCKPLLFLLFVGTLVFTGRATAQRNTEMAKAAALLPPDSRTVVDRLSSLRQRNTEMAKAAALLPPDSRTVVDRLSSLRELPAGAWKMHTGDIAHGEDANLDDSSWKRIAVGEKGPKERGGQWRDTQ